MGKGLAVLYVSIEVGIYLQFDRIKDFGFKVFNLTHLVLLPCPSEKDMDFFTAPLPFVELREAALEEERRIGVG